jgi:hypothetical protein
MVRTAVLTSLLLLVGAGSAAATSVQYVDGTSKGGPYVSISGTVDRDVVGLAGGPDGWEVTGDPLAVPFPDATQYHGCTPRSSAAVRCWGAGDVDVALGPGDDQLVSTATQGWIGVRPGPGDDVVRTGDTVDDYWMGTDAPDGGHDTYDAGGGHDTLHVGDGAVVDLAAGTATVGGATATVAGFEAVEAGAGATVRGGDGDDVLTGGALLAGRAGNDRLTGALRMDGGPGDDVIVHGDLENGERRSGRVRVRCGPGHDRVVLDAPRQPPVLSGDCEAVTLDGRRWPEQARVTVDAAPRRTRRGLQVTVRCDRGEHGYPCRGRVHAAGGTGSFWLSPGSARVTIPLRRVPRAGARVRLRADGARGYTRSWTAPVR